MDRKRTSIAMLITGISLFLISLFLLLPIAEYYVLSLFLMFVAVVMFGISSAMLRGYDGALDQPTVKCYYCDGTGKISKGLPAPESCPRCDGTGLIRSDNNTQS